VKVIALSRLISSVNINVDAMDYQVCDLRSMYELT
jgi:hypothetical protein